MTADPMTVADPAAGVAPARAFDLGLEGRVAVVTGAGSGIGLETARLFLASGARVVGVDLDPAPLEGLGRPEAVLGLRLDLSTAGAGEAAAEAAVRRFGHIDVLFNNAGIAPTREDFLGASDGDWERTLGLNVMGYVRMSRAVLPHMLAQGRGVLLHCGSEAGRMPHPLLPDYSVSKAAVHMLSKVLARGYTARGIRSNVVAPAHIRTSLWDRPGGFLDSLAAEYGSSREEAVRIFLERSRLPAGRLGTPQEVAALVVYLASDLASFISGETFGIDGGVIPVV